MYAFLLDRLSLSQKHHWVAEEYRIYLIFTREEVQEKLNLSDKTVTKSFKQLSNVGLVEEKRQGLGKPNIINTESINHNNEYELQLIKDKYKLNEFAKEEITILEKVIDRFKTTVNEFIHWIYNKFSVSSEDAIIRDFEKETYNTFNIEKQIEHERNKAEENDLEL